MIAQRNFARQFARGDDPSSITDASSLSAESHDHPDIDAVIRGYGHAVYAVRTTSGRLILCEGWRGFSVSTSSQLSKIAEGFRSAGRGEFETDDEYRPGSKYGHPDAGDCLGAATTTQ